MDLPLTERETAYLLKMDALNAEWGYGRSSKNFRADAPENRTHEFPAIQHFGDPIFRTLDKLMNDGTVSRAEQIVDIYNKMSLPGVCDARCTQLMRSIFTRNPRFETQLKKLAGARLPNKSFSFQVISDCAKALLAIADRNIPRANKLKEKNNRLYKTLKKEAFLSGGRTRHR